MNFFEKYTQGIQSLHNYIVVVALNIANYDVHYVFVDNESLADMLFYNPFSKMGFILEQLEKLDSPLIRFFEVWNISMWSSSYQS